MRLVVLSLSMMNHDDLWEGHDNVHIRTTTESLVSTRWAEVEATYPSSPRGTTVATTLLQHDAGHRNCVPHVGRREHPVRHGRHGYGRPRYCIVVCSTGGQHHHEYRDVHHQRRHWTLSGHLRHRVPAGRSDLRRDVRGRRRGPGGGK